MLKNYSDLKSMMVELEKANLDPDTKIIFGDSDLNEYIVVSRATIIPLVDVLNYDSEEVEDEDENGEEFSKEKCIFFEVE